MIYRIWFSICNKYVSVCEDMKFLLFWRIFQDDELIEEKKLIDIYYEKFIFNISIFFKVIIRINNIVIMFF